MKIVIVGGVAGGASAAARLRRLDEEAEILILERGSYISFANCGLPYYIGGEITDKSALTLQTPESFYARFNVDVRVDSEVTAIDRENKQVAVQPTVGDLEWISYDKLVLSMGAEPVRPPIPGADDERVFTLRNIPDTDRIHDYIHKTGASSAVVVGGGFIGLEMAENLSKAGLQVTVVEAADQVMAPIDREMAADVHQYIRSKGIQLRLGATVQSIQGGDKGLQVKLSSGELTSDLLIMAAGVRPESAVAKEAGLQVNARGCIVVSDTMQTSDPDIYAVGDAVETIDFVTGVKGFVPLAGPANKQGRIAANHICGIGDGYTGTQGSSIVKLFDMTVASTGVNEKTAKAMGLDYEKSYSYSASHATYYPGARFMSIKLVYEKNSGKILGAQLVGFDGVDKRCDVLATAIRFGAKAEDLTRLELCYAPPFSSAKDPVNMAGYIVENILTDKTRIFHWHDVDALPDDNSVVKLDVRTPGEYERGHMDGFVNIPVDELRGRMGELPAGKKVYVTCQIGLRGHIACRILSQKGFDCCNLSGGYRLYHAIHRDM